MITDLDKIMAALNRACAVFVDRQITEELLTQIKSVYCVASNQLDRFEELEPYIKFTVTDDDKLTAANLFTALLCMGKVIPDVRNDDTYADADCAYSFKDGHIHVAPLKAAEYIKIEFTIGKDGGIIDDNSVR